MSRCLRLSTKAMNAVDSWNKPTSAVFLDAQFEFPIYPSHVPHSDSQLDDDNVAQCQCASGHTRPGRVGLLDLGSGSTEQFANALGRYFCSAPVSGYNIAKVSF